MNWLKNNIGVITVITTVIVAAVTGTFVATITVHGWILDSERTMRAEFQEAQQTMRNEFLLSQESLRNEFLMSQESLRNEFHVSHESLRKEMNRGFESLRTEFRVALSEIGNNRERVAQLEAKMDIALNSRAKAD